MNNIVCNNKTIYLKSSKRISGLGSTLTMDENIEEYNIDEILNEDNFNNGYFYPKRILLLLSDHIATIISGAYNLIENVFTFCIHSKNHFYIPKNIEIEVAAETSFEVIKNNIINVINNIEDKKCCFHENDCLIMTVLEKQPPRWFHFKYDRLIEDLERKYKIQSDNENKSFKTEVCMICLEAKPNVLFCNCGHISTCEECWENMEEKKYTCITCRKDNAVIRII